MIPRFQLHRLGRWVLPILAVVLFSTFAAVRAAVLRYQLYIPMAVSAENTPTPTPTHTPTATPTPTKTVPPGNPPPPNSPPTFSTSYYMDSIDPAVARNLGCALGNADEAAPGRQEQMVVLDYGSPKVRYGEFGVSAMWRTGFANFAKVYESARQFGYGYWDCVDSDFASHLVIAVGTSNYPAAQHGVVYPSVTYGHGQAFAQMINDLQYWFSSVCTRGCDGQVSVVGASDMELSWNTSTNTIGWVNGYDSINAQPLFNYGALEGCPYFSAPGARCANGWTKDQIMQITTGFIYPVPEVYATNGVNAQQWYLMSLYAYQTRGKAFDFAGVMTTYQACQQYGGCTGIDNTPQAGWLQLYNLVNTDIRTYDSLTYSTDIRWLDVGTAPPSIEDPLGDPRKQAEPVQALLSEEQIVIEEGIFEGSEGLVSPSIATIRNGWEGERGGQALRVLVGASAEDPMQGLVVVIDPLGSEQPGPHMYLAPDSTGSLQIVEVQETQVILATDAGEQIVFDLLARSYR